MKRRKIIGLVLIGISVALIVVFYREVTAHVKLTGVGSDASAIYDPPFPFHGPLVVLAGVGAAASFLAGLHLIGPGKKR